jgi:energy-coupling factor transporter transmembrane protein EcfT
MPNFFYEIPAVLPLIFMYIVFCSIGISGFFYTKLFLNRNEYRNDIHRILWQTILLFTTLFITFWMANNWKNMKELTKLNEKEAHAIENLYNASSDIKNTSEKIKLQVKTLNYLNAVIDKEFKALEHGQYDIFTQKQYQALMVAIYQYPPSNSIHEQLNYDRLLRAADQLSSTRIERLNYLNSELRGPLLIFFILLILFGCFWVGCITSKNLRFALIVIMSQNLVVTPSSWLILEMDKPFQGYLKVHSQAFLNTKQEIKDFKF